MSRKSFYISTDKDGNMPVLSAKPLKSCWVKYVNDRPVAIRPYKDQDRVWDYAHSTMLALTPGLQGYLNAPMKQYEGVMYDQP